MRLKGWCCYHRGELRSPLTPLHDPKILADFFEGGEAALEVGVAVGGGDHDADARLALRDGGVADGAGDANYGDAKNEELDALIDKLEGEMNPALRQDMINRSLKIMQDEVHVIPLHRQVIPWATRANVFVVHRPNNILNPVWVKVQ